MKCFLAIALLLVGAYGDGYPTGFNEAICEPPPNNGGRNFPKIPDNYLSRVEWNDHVTRRSMYMQEYISVTNNIGATYITGLKYPSTTTKYITQGDTGELFMIYDISSQEFEDGNCVVQKLDGQSEFALPFKPDPKYPGTDKLVSGRSLLNLGANPVGNMMYNGTEMKNGIPCDVWIGCLFVTQGKTTLSAKYYFSDSSWQPAGGASPSPVAIHASGQSAQDSNFKLDQTFNYAYFSTQYPSQNVKFFQHVFETPMHTYCPGRINTFNLPAVPMHFEFRAEVIDHLSDTVLFTREYYDFQSNYSRIDFKSPPTGNTTVDDGVSPSSVINDFGTGVTYVIDKYSKECTTMPIVSSEFDSVPLGNGKTRMRTPSEFFDFDKLGKYPYQYMGEHDVRNIPANGWISYRPYPHEGSPYNATWEWYFATKGTIIKAQDLVEIKEPLRLDIKSAEGNVDITYNIFRFSEKVPDPEYFDIRACFEKSGSHIINMQLEGNWTTYNAENNIQLLRYWFQLAVDAFTGVRSIRVQDVQFEFFGKNIGVTFTMLGPAPIKGDIGREVDQVPLKLATDRLAESFHDGIFQVYFMPNVKSVTNFIPVPGTFRIVERQESATFYRPQTNPVTMKKTTSIARGLSPGAAVGLAFGVLFLGILLSLGGVLVFKKLTDPAVPYTPHHNDE